MSSICVIGAGYVGLPTAACFARLGHSVTCTDVDAERIALLARGEVPLLEAELPDVVADGLASGRLTFHVDSAVGAADAEFVVICVPTPPGPNGDPDISAVEAVIREVAPSLRSRSIVVLKSTMPVGSAAVIKGWLAEGGAPETVAVASNPEFLREGMAVRDFLEPHRVVIGTSDDGVARRVASLYEGLKVEVVTTDHTSAELIKYASNAFLATKISFVNELANACEALGADITTVARGMGLDSRIGSEFLSPGPGWGGSCLPKDTAALLHATASAGYDFELVACAVGVNDRQRARVVDKIESVCGGSLRGVTVAVWGLTFKAGTDDLRDSPALEIVRGLVERGAVVRAFDPAIAVSDRTTLEGVELVATPYEACDGAEVLAVLTEWLEFAHADFARAGEKMAARRLFDARNVVEAHSAIEAGFSYRGVGRGDVEPSGS